MEQLGLLDPPSESIFGLTFGPYFGSANFRDGRKTTSDHHLSADKLFRTAQPRLDPSDHVMSCQDISHWSWLVIRGIGSL
jgi:hypothetical protein